MDLFKKIDIFSEFIFRPLHAPLLPRSGGITDFVIGGREGVFFRGQSWNFSRWGCFFVAPLDFAARVWRAGLSSISRIVAHSSCATFEPLCVEIGCVRGG